jgi:CBS domain-containing protein
MTESPQSSQPGPMATPLDERSGGLYRFLGCATDQYMTRAVISVTGAVTMVELEALFERYDFNSFPVVEEGRILGIVTKFDFLRAFTFTTGQMVPHYDELMRRRVADVMTKAVTHVEPQTPLTRVLELMVSFATRSLPVLSLEHKLVGIISREDVMRALRETTQCSRSAASNPPTVTRAASRKDPPPTTSR